MDDSYTVYEHLERQAIIYELRLTRSPYSILLRSKPDTIAHLEDWEIPLSDPQQIEIDREHDGVLRPE